MPSDDCATEAGAARALHGVDGICIPGGFGIRGIEGKIGAISYARTRGIPTLGLCLGLQCMVIESARNLAGIEDAISAEFDDNTGTPVIATMADQLDVVAGDRDMGGTMRLGLYEAKLREGSVVADAYHAITVTERHRHRYEVNNAYRDRIEAGGTGLLRVPRRTAGWWSSASCRADVHPFFVGTQAHPELRSRPTRPHPLFAAFVKAALDYEDATKLPVRLEASMQA